jgi:MFS family permease
MIASSYTLAAAFMSCVVMLIGMPLGRRRCIIIGNVFIAIGGVVQATSYSVPQIIVARVLCVSNALDFLRCVELMSV